jgi:hypothetical protein
MEFSPWYFRGMTKTNTVTGWEMIATYGVHSLWARTQADEPIYVVRSPEESEPTSSSGGYFSIATALKVKGLA